MTRAAHQLDLFAWEPRSNVIPLPVSAWGRLHWGWRVAVAADAIVTDEEEQRRALYLPGSSAQIAKELRKLGVSEPEILCELARYRAAVYFEMGRMRAPARSGPGAA